MTVMYIMQHLIILYLYFILYCRMWRQADPGRSLVIKLIWNVVFQVQWDTLSQKIRWRVLDAINIWISRQRNVVIHTKCTNILTMYVCNVVSQFFKINLSVFMLYASRPLYNQPLDFYPLTSISSETLPCVDSLPQLIADETSIWSQYLSKVIIYLPI